MALQRWLSWSGPVLALVAIFLLPALRASAPMLPTVEWTVAGLGSEVVHAASPQTGNANPRRPGLRAILRQSESLRQQFGATGTRPSRRLGWALGLAAAIPAMAILAGLCGLLVFLFRALRRPRWLAGVAIVGLVATAYAVGASWWLTRVAQGELGQFFTKAQTQFGGLLGALDWKALRNGLVAPLGLTPEPGLYLLFLAFLIILVLPDTQPHRLPITDY